MFENDYIKTCPSCQETFEAKRTNQTYCTQQCKSRYHNGMARHERQEKQSRKTITDSIDKILWKNREILNEYRGMEMSLKELSEEGFKTNFITSFKQKKGESKTTFEVYDVSYKFVDASTLKIK